MALLTTSFRLDESSSTRVTGYLGIYDPCVWLLGILLPRTNHVWRVDYTKGDVWISSLFRLVFIIKFVSSVEAN